MKDYTQILREHNLKATPQRLEIANALAQHGHINIDNLYSIMLQKFSSISLATIYKNINIMLENSFIQEVKLPNEKSVYEITKDSHCHLMCTNCNSVIDIELELNDLVSKVSTNSTFSVQKADLVFSGICQNCQ